MKVYIAVAVNYNDKTDKREQWNILSSSEIKKINAAIAANESKRKYGRRLKTYRYEEGSAEMKKRDKIGMPHYWIQTFDD